MTTAQRDDERILRKVSVSVVRSVARYSKLAKGGLRIKHGVICCIFN